MKKRYVVLLIILFLMPITLFAKENVFSVIDILDDKIVTDITKETATADSFVTCAENIYIPYQIVSVVRSVETFIKIGVPILLIVMGMLDFSKVVFGKVEEQMKKAKSSFIARTISAVLVFLIVSIVEMILPLIDSQDSAINCSKCIMLDDEHCKYVNVEYPETTPTPIATPKPTLQPTATPKPTPTSTPTAPTNTPTPEVPLPIE